MKVALYNRVSIARQEARGTIGSQLAVLRERIAAEGLLKAELVRLARRQDAADAEHAGSSTSTKPA